MTLHAINKQNNQCGTPQAWTKHLELDHLSSSKWAFNMVFTFYSVNLDVNLTGVGADAISIVIIAYQPLS